LKPAVPVPPVPALVLVAAEYKEGENVRLTFDRAVSVAGYDGSDVVIDDPDAAGLRFRGAGTPSMIGSYTVYVGLVDVGPATGTGIRLTAGPGTGIVAAGDGGTWPGVTDLPLPFP
jgi:hypothetical protein